MKRRFPRIRTTEPDRAVGFGPARRGPKPSRDNPSILIRSIQDVSLWLADKDR